MIRSRRVLAATCVALIVVTGFLPLGAVSIDWLEFSPAFTLLPPPASSATWYETPDSHEQCLPLLAVLVPRGPPPSAPLA